MTAETTKSVLPWPVMTLWQQIDGDVLFTHEPTVLHSEEVRQPTPEPRLGEFIELIAGIGINALDLHQPWIEEYFKANPLVSGILPEPVDG
jgi:hypothetical protein